MSALYVETYYFNKNLFCNYLNSTLMFENKICIFSANLTQYVVNLKLELDQAYFKSLYFYLLYILGELTSTLEILREEFWDKIWEIVHNDLIHI